MLVERLKPLNAAKRQALFELLSAKGIDPASLPVVPMPKETVPITSYAQQRQWILWQLDPDTTAYNMPVVLRLTGNLSVDALQRSFNQLIIRHETLRTTFVMQDGVLQQCIHEAMELSIKELKVESSTDDEAVTCIINREIQQQFDLEHGPLLRVSLLRLDNKTNSKDQKPNAEWILIITQHHIVSDGWSMQIMVNELIHNYTASIKNEEDQFDAPNSKNLPDLVIQYKDYAAWQRQWMDSGERQRQKDYWLGELSDALPVLELPTDHTRSAIPSQNGQSINLELAADLVVTLNQLAKREGCTLFMLLLASFQLLLQRYSGQKDICVGVPSANRDRTEVENLIGFFVNTLVLRTELNADKDGRYLLKQVKNKVFAAQAHQDLPFEELVEVLQPERNLSCSPIFQVMFNHQAKTEANDNILSEISGLAIEQMESSTATAKFDLALDTTEHEQGISACFTFSTDLFKTNTIESMTKHWLTLLSELCNNPTTALGELSMLSKEESQQLIFHRNPAYPDVAAKLSIQQRFEAQVLAQP
ncbi:MAG: non-ribosomal peptide synthetase, partial [Gammaproteobacteria bacterium]|nr:non-ribosomal peptide synthetase [Gammaproteobacteria bacterium]